MSFGDTDAPLHAVTGTVAGTGTGTSGGTGTGAGTSAGAAHRSTSLSAIDLAGAKKNPLNVNALRQAWETSTQRVTKDDWIEWLRMFTSAFLRESPEPALHSCQKLAQEYLPLARELFNAAFLSCWCELGAADRAQLAECLSAALSAPSIPSEITQTILGLAEYMDHEEQPLPLESLGTLAQRCHAYAKALRYKEQEFLQEQRAAHATAAATTSGNSMSSSMSMFTLKKDSSECMNPDGGDAEADRISSDSLSVFSADRPVL